VRPMPTGLAYYVACPRDRLVRPEVTALVEWLRAEATSLRVGRPARRSGAHAG
jgi:DNA-binding transcriptional LysR family regulator